MCDAAINYSELVYPLPTGDARYQESGNLPPLIQAFEQTRLIEALEGSADRYDFPDSHLQDQFAHFCLWARKNQPSLRQWLRVHFSDDVKSRHFLRLRHEVQAPIWEFWERQTNTIQALARTLQVESDQLRYAFDVMYRGLQYADMTSGMPYFRHPIRDGLLAVENFASSRLIAFSWGAALFQELEVGNLPRDPNNVADKVARLRELVLHTDRGAYSWYDLPNLEENEQHDAVLEIAIKADMQVVVKPFLKTNALKVGACVLALAHAADLSLDHRLAPALLTFDGMLLAADVWNGGVPKALAKIPLIRSAVEVPGLHVAH